MRKLYALLTGLFFTLTSLPINAQNEAANFTFVVNGNNVHFTNSSNTNTNDTSQRRCLWQFGDGSSLLTHYNVDPYHLYLQAGSYEACLKLYRRIVPTTPNGDTLMLISSICKEVVITTQDSCGANFESPAASPTSLENILLPSHGIITTKNR